MGSTLGRLSFKKFWTHIYNIQKATLYTESNNATSSRWWRDDNFLHICSCQVLLYTGSCHVRFSVACYILLSTCTQQHTYTRSLYFFSSFSVLFIYLFFKKNALFVLLAWCMCNTLRQDLKAYSTGGGNSQVDRSHSGIDGERESDRIIRPVSQEAKFMAMRKRRRPRPVC